MTANVIDMANPRKPVTEMVTGASAIWYPEKPVRPERLMQNLQTLTFLLEDEGAREQVCGPGNWALNEMTDEVEYSGHALTASQYTRIRVELERERADNGRPLQFSEDAVRSIARMLAERHTYSPVRQYLDGLDYRSAAGGEYIEGLGAAIGLTQELHGLELEFLRRWLIAAVARAYQPGCQVDTVLVFQGTEGQYKSRVFEELGGRWFVRMSAELGSRDATETMRRGWIIELDELDSMKRSKEFSTVKAAISRPSDDYVPKWVRESQKLPRRSVLAGTVNDVECLVDEEGLRRFWVVPVGRRIDREWVREHRDSIWAEAVAQYHLKEQWYLTPEQEALQRQHVQQFIQEHPWQELIERHLEARPLDLFEQPVTVQEIYAKVLVDLSPKDQTAGNRRTIITILRRLGYSPVVSGHLRTRGWRRHDRPPG